MSKNYLLDTDFLKQLDESRNRTIYAKIISLTFDEDPIETIEGKITGGTLSIDGSSAVRRTCSSLAMVAQDINITDYYWGLNTKFKLEIGLKTEKTNDEIIWFPQGTFLITAFSTSYSTSGFNINISGQDKMCLLNGTIGGILSAPTDFANLETTNTYYSKVDFKSKTDYKANKYYVKNGDKYTLSFDQWSEKIDYYEKNVETDLEEIPIKTIIREAVHTYANEPYYNIIIKDLDDTGLELLENRSDTPIYYLFSDEDTCDNIICDVKGTKVCFLQNENDYIDGHAYEYVDFLGNSHKCAKLSELEEYYPKYIYNLVEGFNSNLKKVYFTVMDPKYYYIAKTEYGETVGYRMTDLTYAGGELEGQVGDNICNAVLDKIINMLGDYQYYYNVNGQFVFERKGNYINTSWDSLIDTEDDTYAEDAAYASKVIYRFDGNNLISSISNNPQLNNIRNDFSVFGERDIGNDTTVSVHARIAIDDKPLSYMNYENNYWYLAAGLPEAGELQNIFREHPAAWPTRAKTIFSTDWRELIYQMALDYYKYGQEEDFLITVQNNNRFQDWISGEIVYDPYPGGKTGYEQYYIDMQGFWRQLYNPDAKPEYKYEGGEYTMTEAPLDSSNIEGAFERVEVWTPSKKIFSTMTCDYFLPMDARTSEEEPSEYFSKEYAYWNRNVIYAPELLNFWIDFLDTSGELGQYSIKAIGDRPKAVHDSDVNSIYYRTTPEVIFFNNLEEYNEYTDEYKTGYTYVIMPNNTSNMFRISSQGKSAKDVIDSYLYEYTYGAESISLSTIPIYYLEPNNRIMVYDEDSKINGEYLISRMSIPLTYSGTMSIEATKAPQRVI